MITQIGPHKVQHGNVMHGIAKLMGTDQADIFYSDPPWGQGNLNYWQTINVRHNTDAQAVVIEYQHFINQIFNLAAMYAKGIVFIEYGRKWKDDIIRVGQEHGLIHLAVTEPIYRSGSEMLPLHLHIFAKQAMTLPQAYLKSIDGTHGMDTLIRATAPFIKPGGIVLDPCCGMGYSARLAHKLGMTFRGNELNKTRLQKTINFLNTTV